MFHWELKDDDADDDMGTMLQAGRSQDQFPVRSLDFLINLILLRARIA
jgi:hypothetical protein